MNYSIISKNRTFLMGIGILGIMLCHYCIWANVGDTVGHKIISLFGRLVHTNGFMFLSGFGLYYSFTKDDNLKRFYKRRFLRVLGPFILMTLPFYFFDYCIGISNLKDLLLNVTSLAFWVNGNNGMWYISLSLLLYLLFPLFYKFIFNKNNKPFVRLAILLAIFCMLTFLLFYLYPSYYAMVSIGWPSIVMFLLGMYFGRSSMQEKEISKIDIIILFVAFGVLYIAKHYLPFLTPYSEHLWRLVWCLPLCLLIEEIKKRRGMLANAGYKILSVSNWLGRYSLELYVLHILFFHLFQHIGLYGKDQDNIMSCLCIILSLTLCYPANKVTNKVIDRIK